VKRAGHRGPQQRAQAKATGKVGGADLQQLKQRLDRLELLVLLIAQQVGVPHEAIAQRLAASSPPPS
jgi:hypothetical protein